MKQNLYKRFRTKTIFCVIVCLFFFSFSGICQLRQVYTDPTAGNEINKISFYSASQGFVAFRDWIGYTSDSGHTFTQKYITLSNVNYNGYSVNLTFGFSINGVKAFNATTILAYGDYGFVPAILSSVDGGNTFKLIYHNQYSPTQLSTGITDMIFPQNGSIGYAVDADRILKTTNQGQSWTPVFVNPNRYFDDLEAADDNTVFAMSRQYYTNKLYKTTNGGASWGNVPLPLPGGILTSACMISASTQWINLYDNNNNYYLYKTVNSGASWTLQNNLIATPFSTDKMYFTDANTGYAHQYPFEIYKTLNGGALWEPVQRDNNYSYGGSSFNDFQLSGTQMWAGGGHGFLELNKNLSAAPLPKAYFRIDTLGVANTNIVQLLNYSNPAYTSKWYANNVLVGTSYNSTYTHSIYSGYDSVKLVVSNGTYSDSITMYQAYFAVPPPPIPAITSFSPTTGYAGMIDSIYGTNFTGATAVSFGGTPPVSYTVVSPTLITAKLGAGSTGDVSVTTSYGTATAPNFTYITRLKITSFTPATGAPGTAVTINGTNFSSSPSNNIVFFGGVRGTVISATAAQLIVTAPYGASHEPISVTTGGLTAYSALPFVTTFPGSCALLPATFSNRIDSSGELAQKFLAQADLDGDGKPDIIIQDYYYDSRFTLYRNTSVSPGISFASKQYIPVPHGTKGVFAIGDLNGDGKPDLVTSNNNGSYGLSVFLNTSTPGNISFGAEHIFSTAYSTAPNYLRIADMDGDGRPDVLGTEFDKVYVFKNLSSAGNLAFDVSDLYYSYASGGGETYGFSVTDVDLDGLPDAVVNCNYYSAPTIKILKNITTNATIKLTQNLQITNLSLGSNQVDNKMATGDFNGDGKPDFAVIQKSTALGLCFFKNTSVPGSISFDPATPSMSLPIYVTDISAGDLNGDGKPDLVITFTQNSDIAVLINTSSGGNISFAAPVVFARAPFGTAGIPAVTDLNLDGKADIAVLAARNNPQSGSAEDALSIFKNDFCGDNIVTVCSGAGSTITSNITGAAYQWQQDAGSGYANISDNANFSGTASVTLSINNIPAGWTGYKYRCVINGSSYSGITTVNVNANAVPSVSVTASATTICAGSNVIFTATPVNGGTTPVYQWKVNGINAGTNSNTFSTAALANNDVVTVIMTGSAPCSLPASAVSNAITMTVNPIPATASVSVAASQTTICAGSSVIFSATPVNGGAAPSYQWQVNGINAGSNSNTFTSATLANGNTVRVLMTVSTACASPVTTTSNTITMMVNPVTVPTVSIAAAANPVCAGSTAVFTATPVNGGSSPVYQWQVNSINVGTNNALFSSTTLANNDQVSVTMTSSGNCSSPATAASNVITINVNTTLVPAVSITAGSTTICAGTPITFTAAPVNGGAAPVYQWQVNGINAGSNSNIFTTATLANNDQVKLILTSSYPCASPVSSVSNTIGITVNSNLIPAVSISTAQTTVCPGNTVSFTATAVNGGSAPVYQWLVNGVNAGTNSNIFTTASLANNDQVKVVMTSSAGCSLPLTAASNTINMTVGSVTPAVSISTASASVCSPLNIIFTAVPANGGTSPVYQWKINGVNAGTNSTVFNTSALVNGDNVSVTMTSSAACLTQSLAISNTIQMTIGAPVSPVVTISTSAVSICSGTDVSFTATVVNGGPSPLYSWKKNGISTGTNSPVYSSSTLATNDVIMVTVIGNAACSNGAPVTSNSIQITVTPSPVIHITGTTQLLVGTTAFIQAHITPAVTGYYQWQDSTASHSWQNIPSATAFAINYNPQATGNRLRCRFSAISGCGNNIISNDLVFIMDPAFGDPNAPNGGLVLFPSPANSFITVDRMRFWDQWETAEILDATGGRVIPARALNSAAKIKIDVSALSAGVYFVRVGRHSGAPVYLKFVKL